jgi:hypothetical protein
MLPRAAFVLPPAAAFFANTTKLPKDFAIDCDDQHYFYNRSILASVSRAILTIITEDPLSAELATPAGLLSTDCDVFFATGNCDIGDGNVASLFDFSLFFGIDSLFARLVFSGAFDALRVPKKVEIAELAFSAGFDISHLVSNVCRSLSADDLSGSLARFLVREHSLFVAANLLHRDSSLLSFETSTKQRARKAIEGHPNVNELRARFSTRPPRPYRCEGILSSGVRSYFDYKTDFFSHKIEFEPGVQVCVREYRLQGLTSSDACETIWLLGNTKSDGWVCLDCRRIAFVRRRKYAFATSAAHFCIEVGLVCPREVTGFELLGDVRNPAKHEAGSPPAAVPTGDGRLPPRLLELWHALERTMADADGTGSQGLGRWMTIRIYRMLRGMVHEELEQVQRAARERHPDLSMDELLRVDDEARQFHTAIVPFIERMRGLGLE